MPITMVSQLNSSQQSLNRFNELSNHVIRYDILRIKFCNLNAFFHLRVAWIWNANTCHFKTDGINRMALHALTFFDRFLLASRLSIWLIKFFSWLRVMLTGFGILLSSCQKKMTLMQKNKEQKNYLLPIKWIHAWEYMKSTFMRITFFLVLFSHNLNEWMNDRKP